MAPWWFKFMVLEDEVKIKIQNWYDKTKDYLDDGSLNNSTK